MGIHLDAGDNNLMINIKNIIHDLRSPLAALKMLCSYSKDLSDDDKSLLESSTGRMCRIIESFSKKIQEDSKINIHATIEKILKEKKIEYCKSNLQFIYAQTNNTEHWNINGDIDDFERMLSNLLNNAVEACFDKSGVINIDLKATNNTLHLTVGDNGKGIPDEVLQKLRDGESVTHGKEKGQGIGFKQIRDAVAKLNGKLIINSTIGAGTKIQIEFMLDFK